MWPQLSIKPLLANNLIKLNTFENLLRGVHFGVCSGDRHIWILGFGYTRPFSTHLFYVDSSIHIYKHKCVPHYPHLKLNRCNTQQVTIKKSTEIK